MFFIALIIALGTPCQYEDSTNCYWDGGTNQIGHSFLNVNDSIIRLS